MERGALLVEFILVVPLLLFVIGYTIRLTLVLQAQQIAMTLSREVATIIFRTCADLTIQEPQTEDTRLRVDTVRSAAVTAACLTKVRNETLEQWRILRPIGAPESSDQIRLNLTVYRNNFESLSADACGTTTKITHSGAQATSDSDVDDIMCDRNRVVRVQLQFELTPIFDFLSLIPGPGIPRTIPINEETII
jgi:hypothetical protein